ncbi:Kynureninase (L-kynurenine hydrolase) [Podospora pseudopauciseta]|uniref:Kynureninase n=1 Tax=Podospora pseudopauciseta TaxID=2093780 RepID=A0ABR0H330_9PEZI|nr:Kynureninase (L-kynurenine hydrolase) [Podospora pseudopauciseta]
MDSLTAAFRNGQKPSFPAEAGTLEYAQSLDQQDKLGHLRKEFNIPTRTSLKKKALNGVSPGENDSEDEKSIYFVGNSLGAQPKAVRRALESQLETWASIGVNGHFSTLENSPLSSWQDLAESCARKSVDLVGAAVPEEIIYMNTLTANLHLMMASFYKPTAERHKVIIEWKPFPSDWYAIQSQIRHHNLSPSTSLIEIQPTPDLYLTTESILATITEHAPSTALVLLPGIQYYTGQLLDIKTITAHAHSLGIPCVGWDLAHAAGNVPLCLHDWNVDFAVWCTYKYINAGPGSTAGLFLHQKHHSRNLDRLEGWYGADKSVRFLMEKEFQPGKGASGWQLSNPSAIDLASVSAALGLFESVGERYMERLRGKAVVLTGYLECLLEGLIRGGVGRKGEEQAFRIITPGNPLERGTQLSLMLREGILEGVSKVLAEEGVVCDARKPDVIRVAPVPMYCRFEDVWKFVEIFKGALARA